MNSSADQSRQDAFDAWMPERLIFSAEDIEKFDRITGRKSLEYIRKTTINGLASVWTQKFQLLPDKKMLTSHPRGTHVSAKYKCDKGPDEVLALKASRNNSNTSSDSNEPAPFTKTSSSKLDKAKATCTELGFTLGTENHGECVLKMMDN